VVGRRIPGRGPDGAGGRPRPAGSAPVRRFQPKFTGFEDGLQTTDPPGTLSTRAGSRTPSVRTPPDPETFRDLDVPFRAFLSDPRRGEARLLLPVSPPPARGRLSGARRHAADGGMRRRDRRPSRND